jgi:hypothetical protein
MSFYTVSREVGTELSLTLVDASQAPVNGVAFGDITATYRKNGGTFVTKTVLSGEWAEVGDGVYKLSFTAAELNTAGSFRFTITGGSFEPYVADVQIVNNYKDIEAQVIEIKQGLATKVNITEADLLIAQREFRLKQAEQQIAKLLTRVKTAEAGLAALRTT